MKRQAGLSKKVEGQAEGNKGKGELPQLHSFGPKEAQYGAGALVLDQNTGGEQQANFFLESIGVVPNPVVGPFRDFRAVVQSR